MKNCLQCKNEFLPKRERARFCSDICRAKFHQNKKFANKQAEKIINGLKEVEHIERGDKAAKLFEELLKELGNPILNNKKETTENGVDRKKILEEIDAIKNEVIPKERDTFYGRKSWKVDQAKRIEQLELKLK